MIRSMIIVLIGFYAPVVLANSEDKELKKFLRSEIALMQSSLHEAESSAIEQNVPFPLNRLSTTVKAPFELGGSRFWFVAGVTISPEVELIFERE